MLALVIIASPPDEATIWKIYYSGDVEQFARSCHSLPDSLASRTYYNALCNTDASSAVESYQSLINKFPVSPCTPFALERIIAYNYTIGNDLEAERSFAILRDKYPKFKGLIDLAALSGKSLEMVDGDQPVLSTKSSQNIWSVQVGAFRNKKSAEEIGRKIKSFGKVSFVEKDGVKGSMTIVKIGKFNNKDEAVKLALRIRKNTGLKPVVVTAKEKID